jgi:cell division protein FtsB
MAKKTVNHKKIKLLILLGVIIYAAITFLNQQSIINSQLQKQNELLAQESALKQEMDYNQNQLDYIGSDAYIIKEARERLGWLFEDETKYVEVPTQQPDAQTSGTEASPAAGE